MKRKPLISIEEQMYRDGILIDKPIRYKRAMIARGSIKLDAGTYFLEEVQEYMDLESTKSIEPIWQRDYYGAR
jgi:hypothetical protein